MSIKDMINRDIDRDDYVVYFNRIYQVIGVGKADQRGHGMARIVLIDKSKSTREVVKYSKEMCKVPAEEIIVWRLTQ